jgi:hypothetical protein
MGKKNTQPDFQKVKFKVSKLNKQPDFQKVKTKVGKKLPRSQNETRATFRAKTLILKTQFQTEKDGPVSHRNQSWKVNSQNQKFV